MTLYKISPDDFEYFTIVAHPEYTFISSSRAGTTGSLYLYANPSPYEKDVVNPVRITDRSYNDNNLFIYQKDAQFESLNKSNIFAQEQKYLQMINSASVSARKNKRIGITRFEPSNDFSEYTLRKNLIRNWYEYYRTSYPWLHWAYTNYHCLNFFTASSVPSNSVLLYPNTSFNESLNGRISGSYIPQGGFTIQFYINPRYDNVSQSFDYKAGTILHMSSTYAVSLVSGTMRDSRGIVNGYRIKLQLSHSADIAPSTATAGAYPNNLIFLSNDNILKRNHWHHVAIRWGTNTINDGTGSFVIDGADAGTFVIPSSSITPLSYSNVSHPAVLCIGNYYQGTNSGSSGQSIFFSDTINNREGLINLNEAATAEYPASYSFVHKLNAEIHEVAIFNKYRTEQQIISSSQYGLLANEEGLLFYLPPYFVKEAPIRTIVDGDGGVLQTPYISTNGTTDDPFNVAMSFGVGGHYLNIENFLRDFATGHYPRVIGMSASFITDTSTGQTANGILYKTSSVRMRNLFILPCDNGLFMPNYNLLKSGSIVKFPISGTSTDKFVNDLGILDLSYISLDNLVATASLETGFYQQSGSLFDELVGASPEDIGVSNIKNLAVFQRTRDPSSNEVCFFNISNIFYGNRINPNNFELKDSNLSGSDGKVSITLRDNGYGSLYRADALTTHAKWNNIGDILYDEGLIAIKSPNLPFFGQDQFEVNFEGEHNIYVMKVSAEVGAGLFNSSSNPNYKILSSSLEANESDSRFVYITHIDYLDKNLNVVMRTNLAQPIKKRFGDKILFKSSIDV